VLDEPSSIGRVWQPRKPRGLAERLVTTPAIVAALERRLKGRSPRSLLICGEPGTGKTALASPRSTISCGASPGGCCCGWASTR
jgi:hypothetical protein